jgi:1-deoxy-D-xylulose-5-phosphate synthase
VRYPRGKATGCKLDAFLTKLTIGKARVLREGSDIALLVFGTLLGAAREVAEALNATLVDMRFVKPLDEGLIASLARTQRLLVTIEENTVQGGAGSAVNEFLESAQLGVSVLNLGLPDSFLGHGKAPDMLAACGLDAAGIERNIRQRFSSLT